MSIKKKLQEHYYKNKELIQLQERIQHLRYKSQSIKSSSDIGDVPCSGSGNTDKIGSIIATVCDLEDMYLSKLDEVFAEQKEIEDSIAELEPVERLLIRARYIECLGWDEIADIIGYTERHTHRIHSAALIKLSNHVMECHIA